MLGCRPIGDLPRNRPILPREPDAWFDAHRSIGRPPPIAFESSPPGPEITVTETDDADSRHIHERWHATVLARDLDGLMDLYAEDAILESP
jgi:hypothetical protein